MSAPSTSAGGPNRATAYQRTLTAGIVAMVAAGILEVAAMRRRESR